MIGYLIVNLHIPSLKCNINIQTSVIWRVMYNLPYYSYVLIKFYLAYFKYFTKQTSLNRKLFFFFIKINMLFNLF